MAAILRDLEQLGQYLALHTRTTQGLRLQKIIGISGIMRALDPGQRFEHTFFGSSSSNCGGGDFKLIKHNIDPLFTWDLMIDAGNTILIQQLLK